MSVNFHVTHSEEKQPSNSDRKFIPAEIYGEQHKDLNSLNYDDYSLTGEGGDYTLVPCPAELR